MKHDFDARRLHITAFAQARGRLAGQEPLGSFDRLMDLTRGLGAAVKVDFVAHGEIRPGPSGSDGIWLRLVAKTCLPLTCQRCLGMADVDVAVDREFRFAATEEHAAAEDEACDEDILVISRAFNLLELVEDEILMALPSAPMHGTCPVPVQSEFADPDFSEAAEPKVHPFAVLGRLKNKPAS